MMLFILLFLLPGSIQAQPLSAQEFPWSKAIKESPADAVFVCGNSEIQANQKSLRKNFLLGPSHAGLLFTGLISVKEYAEILERENLAGAKARLQARFQKAHLWKVTQEGEAKDLGAPAKIELPFVATVKDCMEGAKTSLGNNCSARPAAIKRVCCQEKFTGPVLKWAEGEAEYRLWFSPDPSLRMRVPGEKKHRFCNVQDELAL